MQHGATADDLSEDADLRTPRGPDRARFQKLTTCEWIRDRQHLLIGGPTGVAT
jgi:hypothetical protein